MTGFEHLDEREGNLWEGNTMEDNRSRVLQTSSSRLAMGRSHRIRPLRRARQRTGHQDVAGNVSTGDARIPA